ncbi:MAG: exopolysaccharide biosynthesis polyprenyl glycosylphosphotransferase, partial [Chloroflexota bacterium]|nr:exopolysaccharide biosynthesis polyprenyl glycosylphosphotransferase [Chloroflexota bacterium]
LSVYDPRRTYKAVDEFQNVFVAVTLAVLVFAGFLYLSYRDVSRLLFITFALLDLGSLLTWRALARAVFRLLNAQAYKPRQVLIVGAGEVGQKVAHMVSEYAWTGLHLVGYLDDDPHKRENDGPPVMGSVDDVRRVVERERIDDVVVALPRRAHGRVNQLVVILQDLPVRVRVVPDYFSLALYRATVDNFGGLPMINLRDPALNEIQRLFKRLFDLAVGGALTLLALPLMGITALAVKLDSPGPVLFRQQRVGENGQLFAMLKFRSMIVGADKMQGEINGIDEEGNVVHKKQNDPRVTRVGRFIRKFSLDELPQLFNVLTGDMSLVGPRPEMPWLVKEYEPWQRKRFAVPQGITGWWQVNGRSDKLMHLHTDEDLFYIQNYSLLLDLFILWKTAWVVVKGKGAY